MSSFQFESPEWFLLIPFALFAAWFWKSLQLFRPLRLITVALLALLLANPRVNRIQNSLDLWVLLDRSASTEDLVDEKLPGWQQLLEESRPSRRDELHTLNYAVDVLEQTGGETQIYSGERGLTRTNLAVQTALASTRENRPSRILLFTDGYSTEPLSDLGEKLLASGVPLDYRLIRDDIENDFAISRFSLPPRAQLGEPFVISVGLRGHADGPLRLQVFRNDSLLTETEVTILDGRGSVEFTDRLAIAGGHNYRAVIVPEEDAHPGNNQKDQWIEITGGPRILLLTNYQDDPLATALRAQGFTIDLVDNPEAVRVGQLAGARACILNNVAAHQLPNGFLEAVDFFVREQGGGLLMAGGKASFGAGGYFRSPIDELLPVSMELKNEHRKLTVAMAIVMDRSGSMGASVAGAGNRTKMDLANSGAASAIDLLGIEDYVTVFAVDSEAHEIVPLSKIGRNKASITNKVTRIQSTGGGIYVYTGLNAAWAELKKSPAGTKHMILFSDAADSEEPGRYRELIAEMRKQDCTVSVIGLGTKQDPDAPFLEDIAKLGDGRIFFTENAIEVPQIFAQETVSVARSAFLDGDVRTQPTGQWQDISPNELNWLPLIDGYNLSYQRPEAAVDLLSRDEYVAPLVSHVQRGFGRVMAVSFPLGGDFSGSVRSWEAYGDFAQTFTRWIMGMDLPPGIGLRHKLEGTRLTVDLLYDPGEWSEKLSEKAPVIKLMEEGSSGPYELTWTRLAPGHFSVTRDLDEGSVVRGSVQVGPHALTFGPLTVSSSAEWTFDPLRLSELATLSARSGGRQLLDLSDAWIRPPVETLSDFRIPLLIALLLVILLDALITRIGWPLWSRANPADGAEPQDTASSEPVRSAPPRPRQSRKKKERAAVSQAPASPPKPAPQPETDRRSRFDRAKRGR